MWESTYTEQLPSSLSNLFRFFRGYLDELWEPHLGGNNSAALILRNIVDVFDGFSCLSIYGRLVSVPFLMKVVHDQPLVHVNYSNIVSSGATCTNRNIDVREPRCGTAAMLCYSFPSASLRSL
jgi:hypothetical protein